MAFFGFAKKGEVDTSHKMTRAEWYVLGALQNGRVLRSKLFAAYCADIDGGTLQGVERAIAMLVEMNLIHRGIGALPTDRTVLLYVYCLTEQGREYLASATT